MYEQLIIECANEISTCLGYFCGTVFWIFVVRSIYDK